MILVTVAQRTAQFLELTACPFFSHTNVQSSKSSATAVKTSISISHYLQQLPQVLRNAIGHCHFPSDTSDLVDEFNSQTLVLASDGSVLRGEATQAWILYGKHTETQAYGQGPVPDGGQLLTFL